MTNVTRQFRVLGNEDDSHLLKVAFATSDRKTVNQHFGYASSFSIYGIDGETARLLSVAEFAPLPHDGSEDKIQSKLALLGDCIAVYCRACGASAVRQLIGHGIQPVKVAEGAVIDELIEQFQQELREGPSTWLAKAIERYRTDFLNRFDAMESDGWTE